MCAPRGQKACRSGSSSRGTPSAPGCWPSAGISGTEPAGIVTGSLVMEQIYGLPGIGRYFINGALQRDYTLVMGVVILYATLVITLNLVADVIYGLLDPKVRYD